MATLRQRISQLERRNPPATDRTPIHALKHLTDHELDQLETLLADNATPGQAQALIQTALDRHHAATAAADSKSSVAKPASVESPQPRDSS